MIVHCHIYFSVYIKQGIALCYVSQSIQECPVITDVKEASLLKLIVMQKEQEQDNSLSSKAGKLKA